MAKEKIPVRAIQWIGNNITECMKFIGATEYRIVDNPRTIDYAIALITPKGTYLVERFGYISLNADDDYSVWYKSNFEEIHTIKESTMNFARALDCLRTGLAVCRTGWNGKNMYVTVIKAGNAMYTKNGESAPIQDCLGLRNAQGLMQPGWVPSQGDLFADDWEIYDK